MAINLTTLKNEFLESNEPYEEESQLEKDLFEEEIDPKDDFKVELVNPLGETPYERVIRLTTSKSGAEALDQAIKESYEKKKVRELKATIKKGLYEQLNATNKKAKKEDKVEEEILPPVPKETIYSWISDSDRMWNIPSDTVRVDREEYDKLIANQKPKEWSDDVALIDINKLTAYLISEYSGVDMEGDELYSRHKQNAFSDEQFEMWDKMYQTILKFRSNEQ